MQKTVFIARTRDDADYTYHAPPAAWLGELIECDCGHGIGRHSFDGCSGRYGFLCRCRHNPSEVLEGAIRDAREQCELEASRTQSPRKSRVEALTRNSDAFAS